MAEPLQLTGICSVAVQVRNLDRSLAFYRDMLGLCLEHREGWIAQLHGHGGAPRRSCCLNWAIERARTTLPQRVSHASRGGLTGRRISTSPSTCSRAMG